MPATFALVLATMFGSPGEPEGPSVQRVREAVELSIPYIEQQGLSWIQERKCVSCHRVGVMVWSLNSARQEGFAVDDRLDEWVSWSIDASLEENDKGKIVGSGNKEGIAQILMTLDTDAVREMPERAAIVERLAQLISDGQEPEGFWKPGGQLPSQKRPVSETTDVSTMWLTLALMNRDDANSMVVDKAKQWISQSASGKSTEWYAVRLLLARRMNDEQMTSKLVGELRKQQQSDGGWGWIVGETSDALGTGLGLYALIRSGVARDDPMVKRAQYFLVESQRNDGSWAVKGTKAKKQERVQETAVYWGTAWATLGLLSSLAE